MNTHTEISEKIIYRFNFSNELIEELLDFSRLNMYTDRKTFKEKWIEWTETNSKQLQIEYDRLVKLGYSGDFNNKLFKATRYYFKQKHSIPKTEKELPKTPTKREYIPLDYSIVELIDKHIKESYTKTFKPSIGYNNFIDTYKDEIDKEITNLKNSDHLSLDTREKCLNKIKKSYKNHSYNYINSIH